MLHLEVTEYCSENVSEKWLKSEICSSDLRQTKQPNSAHGSLQRSIAPFYRRPEMMELSWDNSQQRMHCQIPHEMLTFQTNSHTHA